MVTGGQDINSDSDWYRATESDKVHSSNLGTDNTMAPGVSVGQSNRHGPSASLALRWRLRPQVSVQSLVITWVLYINTDPGCSKIMDPVIVLRSTLVLDVTMAIMAVRTLRSVLFQ